MIQVLFTISINAQFLICFQNPPFKPMKCKEACLLLSFIYVRFYYFSFHYYHLHEENEWSLKFLASKNVSLKNDILEYLVPLFTSKLNKNQKLWKRFATQMKRFHSNPINFQKRPSRSVQRLKFECTTQHNKSNSSENTSNMQMGMS